MIARGLVSKNWVFTINNFSDIDVVQVELLAERDGVVRCFAEKEHIDGNGTPHIQGYVSFSNPTTREHLSELLLNRAFIDKARGGWMQNYRYCTKENNIIVTKGGPSEDSPLNTRLTEQALEDMKKMDPREFADAYPTIWFYHRGKVLNMMMDNAMRNLQDWNGCLTEKNFWVYGDPGLGKTRWATSLMSIDKQYKKNSNKWWCGYSLLTHKVVIVEDMDPARAFMLTQLIKLWGDRYPFMGEVKNGSVMVEPGRFFLIITSNYSIEECFQDERDKNAIKRRFKELHFTAENVALMSAVRPNVEVLQ